jgi:Amt family ammonium transporter
LVNTDRVGTIAANAAVSTALSGAAGGISALFTNLWIEERKTGEPSFSLVMAMNGALSGLVAVTSGCALVEPWAAVVIGIIAGWLYIFGSALLIRLRIDDAVDAIPVHMVNGMWGLLATGLVASPRKLEMTYGASDHVGWFYSLGRGSFDARLLANQVLMLLFILAWTFFTMFPFFIWLNYKGWLRADSLEELVGLDISYHGGMNSSSSGDCVKKEYVQAYNRHKGSLRKRRGGGGSFRGTVDSGSAAEHTGVYCGESSHDGDREMNETAGLEEGAE